MSQITGVETLTDCEILMTNFLLINSFTFLTGESGMTMVSLSSFFTLLFPIFTGESFITTTSTFVDD